VNAVVVSSELVECPYPTGTNQNFEYFIFLTYDGVNYFTNHLLTFINHQTFDIITPTPSFENRKVGYISTATSKEQ